MHRRLFLRKSLRGLLAALAAPRLYSCSNNFDQPNFILILIDDLGRKDVGFMGSDYYETPNIDRLAAEGMIFIQAYANAPNCAPTRASLLSGQYSPRHGVYTVGSPERGNPRFRKLVPVANNPVLSPEIVIICSDNGGHGVMTSMAPLRGSKGMLYEPQATD
ncbi:sulfatase-like hydrolase/transferase [candidate division KSB1 bacterium]|nr:sulfatase-like hydrolase/transferase [candidate division KSB1 bacterium]